MGDKVVLKLDSTYNDGLLEEAITYCRGGGVGGVHALLCWEDPGGLRIPSGEGWGE